MYLFAMIYIYFVLFFWAGSRGGFRRIPRDSKRIQAQIDAGTFRGKPWDPVGLHGIYTRDLVGLGLGLGVRATVVAGTSQLVGSRGSSWGLAGSNARQFGARRNSRELVGQRVTCDPAVLYPL